MTAGLYAPADLLPHAPPMVLLDAVEAYDAISLTATLTIRPGIRFFEAGRGVPAHVAMEWMAQACGAYTGHTAKAAGRRVSMGFLLGTRRFVATQPWFVEGEALTVCVTHVFRDSGMAMFDCRIQSGDTERATALLTVYELEDASAVLPPRMIR